MYEEETEHEEVEQEEEEEQQEEEEIPEEEQEEEQEEEESTESEDPAPVFSLAQEGEDSDDAELRSLMGDAAYSALMRKMEARIGRQMQAQTVATAHVTSAAARHPELFRQYGAQISQSLSQLAPDLRSKPEGVNVAIANALLIEAQKTGDIGTALQKMAAMTGGKTPAGKSEAKPKSPIPATQRAPAPAIRGGTVRAGRPTTTDRMSKFFPGVSPNTMGDLLEEMRYHG